MAATRHLEQRDVVDLTIASGQTASSVADLADAVLVGIETPAALTGTVLTFVASSVSAAAAKTVYDDLGVQVSVAVGASRSIPMFGQDWSGFRFVGVVSNAAEGAARTIKLITRPRG